jgi:hypothetical protein
MLEAIKNQILSIDYKPSNPKTYVVLVPGVAEVVYIVQQVNLPKINSEERQKIIYSDENLSVHMKQWREDESRSERIVFTHAFGMLARLVGCVLLERYFHQKKIAWVIAAGVAGQALFMKSY